MHCHQLMCSYTLCTICPTIRIRLTDKSQLFWHTRDFDNYLFLVYSARARSFSYVEHTSVLSIVCKDASALSNGSDSGSMELASAAQ